MYASICEWDNLWLAYKVAAKGKRGTASVARFEFQVADRLVELQDELQTRTYRPGPYTHFTIHVRFANTWGLRRVILGKARFSPPKQRSLLPPS
jgi:hypothetical protein